MPSGACTAHWHDTAPILSHDSLCRKRMTLSHACTGRGSGRQLTVAPPMPTCCHTRPCCSTASGGCWQWCLKQSTSCRSGLAARSHHLLLAPPEPLQAPIPSPPLPRKVSMLTSSNEALIAPEHSGSARQHALCISTMAHAVLCLGMCMISFGSRRSICIHHI